MDILVMMVEIYTRILAWIKLLLIKMLGTSIYYGLPTFTAELVLTLIMATIIGILAVISKRLALVTLLLTWIRLLLGLLL